MTKQRIDIMCDIETLGRKDSAPIIQIAAVKFDITTGSIYDTFNVMIDVTKCNTIEGGTLLWWLQTDAALLLSLLEKGTETHVSEEEAIKTFVNWITYNPDSDIKQKDIFFWGNGILFDNRLIQSKCMQYGIEYPIFYRNDRDMRTLVELAALKAGNGSEFEYRSHFEQVGDKHNAIDDCMFQINVLRQAYQDVMGHNQPEETTYRISSYGSAAAALFK